MPEPAPDEITVSTRSLVRLTVEVRRLAQGLTDLKTDLTARVTHLETVVKNSGLNGHSADIKTLAELAPEIKRRMADPQMARLTEMVETALPTMEKLVTFAPDIVAAIEASKARATFKSTLLGLLFPKPIRYVLQLAVGAAITAVVFLVMNALWLHIHLPA
jgi:hypothetical protein